MTDEDGNEMEVETAFKELIDVVVDWHGKRKGKILEIVESSRDGKPIKLDLNGDDIELKDDKLSGFRVGLVAALAIFGDLPFSVQDPCAEPDDEEPAEEIVEVPVRPADFGHFS